MHREVCHGQRHGHAGSQALCCTPLCSQAPASTGTAAATAGDPRRHCPCGRGRLHCPLSAGPGSPTLFLCLKHWTVPHGGAGKAARGRGVLLPLPSSKRQASAGLTTPRTQHGKPEASFCHTRSPPPVGSTAPHQGMPPSCTAPSPRRPRAPAPSWSLPAPRHVHARPGWGPRPFPLSHPQC